MTKAKVTPAEEITAHLRKRVESLREEISRVVRDSHTGPPIDRKTADALADLENALRVGLDEARCERDPEAENVERDEPNPIRQFLDVYEPMDGHAADREWRRGAGLVEILARESESATEPDELRATLSLRDCADILSFIAATRGESGVIFGGTKEGGPGFGLWLLTMYAVRALQRHVGGGAS